VASTVYEEVFGCGFALVGQNLIMQIKDSGRDNVSNTTRSPPCPPAIRICRRSGGSCKPEWRWQKAICTVRARRFKTPSRLLIDLKFCSQPGKPLRLHRRYASTQKKSKPPKRIATAEFCIPKIADSFEPNEPLRATFLAATPVRRILCERVVNKAKRQHGSRRVAAP
jgi:hypothetical protein